MVNPKFYDKIKENAKDIRTLKFTGGELTLIPQVHEIMDYMLESSHARTYKHNNTTNGTYKEQTSTKKCVDLNLQELTYQWMELVMSIIK